MSRVSSKIRVCVCVCACVGATQARVKGGYPLIFNSVLQCFAVCCSELNCAPERLFVCHVSKIKCVCVCVCVCVRVCKYDTGNVSLREMPHANVQHASLMYTATRNKCSLMYATRVPCCSSSSSIVFIVSYLHTLTHTHTHTHTQFKGAKRLSCAVCCSVLRCAAVCRSVLQCVAVRCSVLQCVAVCCGVLQCVAMFCGVLQCSCCLSMHTSVAVCCNVLRCVAVCCSVL